MITQHARLNSILALLPTPRIALDLGCGACTDLISANFYGAEWVVGVDHDLLALRWAKRLNTPRLWLVHADIAHLPLTETFDLVLVRHPDVVRSRPAWLAALNALPRLSVRRGHILLTTYEQHEIDWIQVTVQAVAPNLTPIPLPDERLAPVGLAGRDRFYRVYRCA